ncbi:hypothetical protein HDU96_005428 [Phlyctochytrium bullatum]|nr:hypothetical protein HDU96_005428 [Phlyctochytrium bullatum]
MRLPLVLMALLAIALLLAQASLAVPQGKRVGRPAAAPKRSGGRGVVRAAAPKPRTLRSVPLQKRPPGPPPQRPPSKNPPPSPNRPSPRTPKKQHPQGTPKQPPRPAQGPSRRPLGPAASRARAAAQGGRPVLRSNADPGKIGQVTIGGGSGDESSSAGSTPPNTPPPSPNPPPAVPPNSPVM